VIDCGLVREIQLANKGKSGSRALVTTWCSRASAKQRMGRAGRVGPGVCYRLFSSFTHAHVMSEFAVPELQRTPLEELCLQVHASNLARSAHSFLMKAPEPPSPVAIASAIRVLKEVGALTPSSGGVGSSEDDGEGTLTPLGVHLAKLPLDVRLGKMLIFGALFRCLDPILTIAAALSCSKSPFMTPIGREQEARHAHSKFEIRQSDFLTLDHVFREYREVARESGASGEARWCSQHFLGRVTLREIRDLRGQYLTLLMDIGFVERPANLSGGGTLGGEAAEAMIAAEGRRKKGWNAEAKNFNLVHAVICAGLYPHVAKATEQSGGRPAFSHGPASSQSAVYLHSSSVNNPLRSYSSPWLVFHEKFHTVRAYIAPTAVVSPFALLLFGGDVAVSHLENRVTIDEWIEFQCPARTAVLFREMRRRVTEVLEDMVKRPVAGAAGRGDDAQDHEAVVDAIVSLLRDEDIKVAWVPGGPDDPDASPAQLAEARQGGPAVTTAGEAGGGKGPSPQSTSSGKTGGGQRRGGGGKSRR
jgi:ATP-dependent RNA helicase DHX29